MKGSQNGWRAALNNKMSIKELFAAVVNKDTLRGVLAILAYVYFDIVSVDIISAFLNGDLQPKTFS